MVDLQALTNCVSYEWFRTMSLDMRSVRGSWTDMSNSCTAYGGKLVGMAARTTRGGSMAVGIF